MLRHVLLTAAATAAIVLVHTAASPSTAGASPLFGHDGTHGVGLLSAGSVALLGVDGTHNLNTASVSADWMQSTYYQCNPSPHSEKAYKRGDVAPPTAAVPTVVGASGKIAVLLTSIYNRNPQGTGGYGVMAADGTELRSGTLSKPGVAVIGGLTPGMQVFIQPRTMGTMAKILTPEQIAACGMTLPGA